MIKNCFLCILEKPVWSYVILNLSELGGVKRHFLLCAESPAPEGVKSQK